jgi:hypothetical protein
MIIIDIIYIDSNQAILYIMDKATGYQAARFLDCVSTIDMWEILRLAWINIY